MPLSAAELNDLQERKNEIGQEIRTLGALSETWTAEDEAKFDELNGLYDSNESVMEAERRAIKAHAAETRIAELEARSESVEQGSTTYNRLILRERERETNGVTWETRMTSLQGFLRLQNGKSVKPIHEDAFQRTGFNPINSEFTLDLLPTRSLPGGHCAWACSNGLTKSSALLELERRDMGTAATAGGETIPIGFQRTLINAMLAFGGPRQVMRIFTTAGFGEFRWPLLDDTANAATIVDEATSSATSVDATTSEAIFRSAKYTSLVLASAELLDDSAFNMASEIANMLGTRVGRGTAADFTNGSGVVGGSPDVIPEGLVTAAVDASVTVPAAGADPVDGDFLVDLLHSVDPAYRSLPSFGWMMNDGTMAIIRKLKTSTLDYVVWQQSLVPTQPDMLLGKPYTINQAMPAWAASAEPILIGAYEMHAIRDVSAFRFYRLEELYRATDQTGFQVYSRHDARSLDAGTEPIKKLVQPL